MFKMSLCFTVIVASKHVACSVHNCHAGLLCNRLKCLYCTCSENVEQAVDKCGLQRITLLREISIKTGIQVRQHLSAFHLNKKAC